MGKASLVFTVIVVIVAVVFAAGGRQAMAQIKTATVDQYLKHVGEDASTTSHSFRESRSEGPEALATPDTSSDAYSNAANTPSASRSETTSDTTAPSLGASANATTGNLDADRGQTANPTSSLPETGGPDATTLLWGVIALASLLPCHRIARNAATDTRDPG